MARSPSSPSKGRNDGSSTQHRYINLPLNQCNPLVCRNGDQEAEYRAGPGELALELPVRDVSR